MPASLPSIGPVRARALLVCARLVSGTLFLLGLLGMLKTGFDDLGADSAEDLLVFTVHPLSAGVWLVLGLVGVQAAATAQRAQRFLLAAGAFLVLWALLSLIVGGDTLFMRDRGVLALNLAFGAASLLVALAPLPGRAARTFG